MLRGVEKKRSICIKIGDEGYRLETVEQIFYRAKEDLNLTRHMSTSVDMGGGSTVTSKPLHLSGTEACECSASGPKRGCGSETGYLRTGGATGDKLSVVSTVNAKAT